MGLLVVANDNRRRGVVQLSASVQPECVVCRGPDLCGARSAPTYFSSTRFRTEEFAGLRARAAGRYGATAGRAPDAAAARRICPDQAGRAERALVCRPHRSRTRLLLPVPHVVAARHRELAGGRAVLSRHV